MTDSSAPLAAIPRCQPCSLSTTTSTLAEAPVPSLLLRPTVTVGTMVETARRCWPGSNKPGGIAKIEKVHYDPDTNEVTHIDVKYPVEGNREKRVAMKWVKVQERYLESEAQHGMENRGAIGRCTRCGSLRKDCSSCDWKFEEEKRRLALEQAQLPPPAPPSSFAADLPPSAKARTPEQAAEVDVFGPGF